MRSSMISLGVALLAVVSRGSPAAAQNLAGRLNAVRDGTVRLSFAARPEMCGDGRFIGIDTPRGFHMYTFNDGGARSGYSMETLEDVQPECKAGPVRLVVEKAAGRITDLRIAVGVPWRAASGLVDLGQVSAPEAAAWALDNVASLSSDLLAVAFLVAVGADSARVGDRLVGIAGNRVLPADARSQSLRWLTDVSAREGKPTAADDVLRAIVRDERDVTAVRERAVRELDRTTANDGFLREAYAGISVATIKDRVIRRLAESEASDNAAWLRALVLNTTEATPLRDRAIRVLAEQRHLDFLQQTYKQLDTPVLKDRVLRSIAEANEAGAHTWLVGIAADEQERVELRDRAIRLLSEGAAPSAELAGLYDRVSANELKQRIVRLLADRGDDAAVEKLTAIAEMDADLEMRRYVLRRLGQTKNPKARAYLERKI